ncbi:MBL fold metallo-hydrolase [Ornithinimicrobium cavernae]|uniref:MBL fold metallo-hydrolase n=1 Tax=Ornithinimicrobium cavernae TaxID=2666047 RepID=UPI000D69360F|nr:MBL fold metallo-hydrolase [Ornithinimicrobium cavernae]
MHLTVVGCSGSFAGPDSPASCYLLQAEMGGRTWRLVLDLGSGALGALQRHTDPLALDAVVLSHLHPDHCLDLTGLHVMRSHCPTGLPGSRLPVHGPEGTAERMARAHGVEGPTDVSDVFEFVTVRDRQDFTVGPFRLVPVAVNHPVAAFGFRVEAGGATIAYTGDTDSCPALLPLMADADLVLADSAFVEGRDHGRGIHLSGRRAAQAAVAAGGVQRLMLTHIPAWNDPEVCRGQAAEVWPGEVELAEPGRTYVL